MREGFALTGVGSVFVQPRHSEQQWCRGPPPKGKAVVIDGDLCVRLLLKADSVIGRRFLVHRFAL